MSKIQLGLRLPEEVVEDLKSFCESHGLIIARFVEDAVEDKLREAKETEEDLATIEARKFESSMSETKWNKFLKTKGINV